MFRPGGRHLRRRRYIDEEALALLARDDESGVESGSEDGIESDVEELEGEEKEEKDKATKVAPGRPTGLPLPPGLRPPIEGVLPTGEPIPPTPGSPADVSSVSFESTLGAAPSPSPAPPQPPAPGIIPVENPSAPALPSASGGPSAAPSSTTTTTATRAPNLPITFPTTFRTSSIPIASSTLYSSGLPSSTTSDIPVVDESPTPSPYPGPGSDPNPAAQVDPPKATLKPGAKAGIAMGTIAGVAMLASLLFFLWRRYHLRKARDSLTFFTSPTAGAPGPEATTSRVGDPLTRTDSQILNDLLATAYAHQNGRTTPPGIASEKAHQVLTVLDRVPPPEGEDNVHGANGIPNATIRSSIASWLRRHHPLQLNPMADGEDARSREGSINSPSSPRSPGIGGSGSIPKSPGIPKSPSPLSTMASTPEDTRPPLQQHQKPQQQQQQGKFLSVWSDTSRATSVPSSEGLGSVLGYYGQALGSPTETAPKEGDSLPAVGKNRSSSPVLGVR
ncbi:hypothetical protein B0T16DRAFT_402893 [Cercophora newfieldiana]|uniref:Uncharacterized protein n=1 Tax=Cercophora newfieldiana TaxID=92897 RepID=A0AA40D2N4_9PEZI|nr:hypothetical protein B0T16DRAFT_402893 [Cercophora newfieldiana]